MATPPFGDFGPDINTLLNRLGCYLVDRNIDAKEAELAINAGIAAGNAFHPDIFGAELKVSEQGGRAA